MIFSVFCNSPTNSTTTTRHILKINSSWRVPWVSLLHTLNGLHGVFQHQPYPVYHGQCDSGHLANLLHDRHAPKQSSVPGGYALHQGCMRSLQIHWKDESLPLYAWQSSASWGYGSLPANIPRDGKDSCPEP